MSTPSQVEAVKVVYDDLQAEVIRLEAVLVSQPPKQRKSVEEEIALAIKRLENLNELASSPDHRAAIDELISSLDVRVYCRFIEIKRGKQVLNKLIGGMITFGSRPAPVKTYEGPTGRGIIKNILAKGEQASLSAGDTVDDKDKQQSHGSERGSLRNKNWRTRQAVETARSLATTALGLPRAVPRSRSRHVHNRNSATFSPGASVARLFGGSFNITVSLSC